MNQKLTNYLFNKYPKIFVQKDLDGSQTRMCDGFCCGDGWVYLIDNLCKNIQNHIDNPPWVPKNDGSGEYGPPPETLTISQVEATQVKEKFGGLRYYYTGGDDKISDMVESAEDLSYHICEECGSMKGIGTTLKGWIRNLCKDCFIEFEKNKNPSFDEETLKEFWDLKNPELELLFNEKYTCS